jgi:hypothetical protein
VLSGRFSATAVTLHFPRSVIGHWLPTGLNLPHADLFPLHILFGEQSEVTAYAGGRVPFPWRRLQYREIIAVVPDLVIDPRSERCSGLVSYLPRLYMNSWQATLLGRGFWGFAKAFARIENSERRFQAWSRRGGPLLEARTHIRETPHVRNEMATAFLDQPIAVRTGSGLALLHFDLSEVSARPLDCEIAIHSDFLINMPETRVAMCTGTQICAQWTLHRCAEEIPVRAA